MYYVYGLVYYCYRLTMHTAALVPRRSCTLLAPYIPLCLHTNALLTATATDCNTYCIGSVHSATTATAAAGQSQPLLIVLLHQ
jgi:hypothetical protein